jgi:hypothetical protein
MTVLRHQFPFSTHNVISVWFFFCAIKNVVSGKELHHLDYWERFRSEIMVAFSTIGANLKHIPHSNLAKYEPLGKPHYCSTFQFSQIANTYGYCTT